MSDSTELKHIKNEPGVADLPMAVKGPFILAIKAEREGDHERAAEKLQQAVEAEEQRS